MNTQTIANTFILLGAEEKIPITPMKLQKLVYFLYKEFLQQTGDSLFTEPFEKWKYGPVLPSLYYEFNTFGAEPITKFARDAKGEVKIVSLKRGSQIKNAFDVVWEKYKNYTAVELSRLTHSTGSAWDRAKGLKLSDEDIKNEEDLW